MRGLLTFCVVLSVSGISAGGPRSSQMQRQMLEPIVQVDTSDGMGSGVIIDCHRNPKTKQYDILVLTDSHVIQDVLDSGLDSVAVTVFTYDEHRFRANIHRAQVVDQDATQDIALLRIRDNKAWTCVAKILPARLLPRVSRFDQVFSVGCPLGEIPPTPAVGILSGLDKKSSGQTLWQSSAPAAPGDSGGGVFVEVDGEFYLLGMIVGIGSSRSGNYPHICVFTPSKQILPWLDRTRCCTTRPAR